MLWVYVLHLVVDTIMLQSTVLTDIVIAMLAIYWFAAAILVGYICIDKWLITSLACALRERLEPLVRTEPLVLRLV